MELNKQLTEKERLALNNMIRVISFYGIPVKNVKSIEDDRVYWYTDDITPYMNSLKDFKKWDLVANHGFEAIRGWREDKGFYSAQVILYRSGLQYYISVDVDVANPGYGDFVSFVGHFLEISFNKLFKKKTNQELIAKKAGSGKVDRPS